MGNEHNSTGNVWNYPKKKVNRQTYNSYSESAYKSKPIYHSQAFQPMTPSLKSYNVSLTNTHTISSKSDTSDGNISESKSNVGFISSNKQISPRVGKIAADFWYLQIESKPIEEKLGIACSIYFSMMVQNKLLTKILKNNLNTSIEEFSLKLLDMMGWLIRALCSNNNNDPTILLSKLGAMHKQIGVEMKHFECMLESIRETFSFYFPIKYSMEVHYAIDQIFMFAARKMTGKKDKKYIISQSNSNFLQSLTLCLQSDIGKKYLFRFLQSTYCAEMGIFLDALYKFKSQTSDKERFMTARSIIKNNISSRGIFALNIPYEERQNTLAAMRKLECQFAFHEDDEKFIVPKDLFKDSETEVKKLILQNHWIDFVKTFKELQ